MEIRDEVYVLRGCGFPIALRRDRHTFKIVGAAYMVGFMHGQFIERHLVRHQIKEKDFEISWKIALNVVSDDIMTKGKGSRGVVALDAHFPFGTYDVWTMCM